MIVNFSVKKEPAESKYEYEERGFKKDKKVSQYVRFISIANNY